MRFVRKLPQSIALNTAGGESKALGSVRIACPKFEGGSFNALVMPETPRVVSVGERCMDHGFSFLWPAGRRPSLPIVAQRSKSGPDRGGQRGTGSVDVRGRRWGG
eukprot:7345515-Pyramimonas_sp.AAC.1